MSSSNKTDTVTGFTPFLVVNDGAAAIEFYTAAFGAVLLERYEGADERITAKLTFAGAGFWIGDEEPEFGNYSAKTIGASPVRLILTLSDPDEVFARALAAGATEICPVRTEEFWKIGKLTDPFGHIWEIGHPLSGA